MVVLGGMEKQQQSSAEDAFQGIKNWLDKNIPEISADINLGAGVPEIEEFKSYFSSDLPESFIEVYKKYDGQSGEAPSLFCGYYFLNLDQIIQEKQLAEDILLDESLDNSSTSYESEKILPVFTHTGRVNFASDGSGNYLSIDLEPGQKGNVGQVINCGRDDKLMYVLAKDINEFMSIFKEFLESGKIKIVNDPDLGKRLSPSEGDNLINIFTRIQD